MHNKFVTLLIWEITVNVLKNKQTTHLGHKDYHLCDRSASNDKAGCEGISNVEGPAHHIVDCHSHNGQNHNIVDAHPNVLGVIQCFHFYLQCATYIIMLQRCLPLGIHLEVTNAYELKY